MKLDKATVTIPYEEFEKHQQDLSRLKEALERAESLIGEQAELVYLYFEYMNHVMKAQFSSQSTISIHQFAKDKGFEVDTDVNMNYQFKRLK